MPDDLSKFQVDIVVTFDKHFPVVFLMISSAFYFLTQIIVLSLQSQTSCLEDSYCKSTWGWKKLERKQQLPLIHAPLQFNKI